MSEPTMNQYAPPLATVADMAPDAGVAELKLFSAQGRIGRLRYLAYTTGASLVYGVVVAVLTAALFGTAALGVVTFVAVIAVLWFSIVSGIKRCHDINISGWWSLTSIIPIIALIWVFVPGSKGANRFGPPPPPNTWGVRLLGVLAPLLFFVGILAAIALPAYKGYTDRARAAQAAAPR